MNDLQVIQLRDSLDYEPKALICVYGEEKEETQEEADMLAEVTIPVIYLSYEEAHSLANELLNTGRRLVAPAE